MDCLRERDFNSFIYSIVLRLMDCITVCVGIEPSMLIGFR